LWYKELEKVHLGLHKASYKHQFMSTRKPNSCNNQLSQKIALPPQNDVMETQLPTLKKFYNFSSRLLNKNPERVWLSSNL